MFTPSLNLFKANAIATFRGAVMLSLVVIASCSGPKGGESANSSASESAATQDRSNPTNGGLQQAMPEGPAKDSARAADAKRVFLANCELSAKAKNPNASAAGVTAYCQCLAERTSFAPISAAGKSSEELMAMAEQAQKQATAAEGACASQLK